jgi:hypothetical protein
MVIAKSFSGRSIGVSCGNFALHLEVLPSVLSVMDFVGSTKKQ